MLMKFEPNHKVQTIHDFDFFFFKWLANFIQSADTILEDFSVS